MNEMSIFSVSIGKCFRCVSDRVAGAEVVDRDREALARAAACSTLLIASRSCSRLVSVTSSSIHRARSPPRATISRDALREILAIELACRQVDRHVSGRPALRHAAHCCRGGTQHPLAERMDQARLLGERDEHLRRHVAVLGVVPAQQRLGADDRAVGDAHHRLVVQLERALLQRRAQRAFPACAARAGARPGRRRGTGRCCGRVPSSGTSRRRRA